MTLLLAAHKRLLTRAKVYLYRQKPYGSHKDDRLVLVLEMQSAELGRRARYCLEEGASMELVSLKCCLCVERWEVGIVITSSLTRK
jgi:hypothetical protein